MDNSFNNIDEAFREAFQHAEAPFSASDLHADWSKVSQQIPASPAPHAPGAHITGPHSGAGMGNIGLFAGIGAAIITSIVILYNIYVKPETNNDSNVKPLAEQQITKPGNDNATVPGNKSNTYKQEIILNPQQEDSRHADQKNSTHPQNYADSKDFQPDQPRIQNDNPETNPEKNYSVPGNGMGEPQSKPQLPFSIHLAEAVVCINQPVFVTVNNGTSGMSINWGDGVIVPLNPEGTHSYQAAGRYTIYAGDDRRSDRRTITVIEKPRAKFSSRQNDKRQFTFSNNSTPGSSLTWIFGDGSEAEHGFYAVHTYPDTGSYSARLVATNNGGCNDTFSQIISVGEYREPQVYPLGKGLTPNGDGINDEFYVIIQDETYFRLTIVDRTGQIVFETRDKNQHWDGKNQKTGTDCPDGSYYYCISYSYGNNSEPGQKRDAIYLTRTMLR